VGLIVSANSVAAVVALAVLGFWAYCLYDFARTDPRDIRTFSQPVWVLLLVLTSVFGGLLWLVYGRPQPPSRRG
jgi:hypothetical protein